MTVHPLRWSDGNTSDAAWQRAQGVAEPGMTDYDDPADAEPCMDCGKQLLLSDTVYAVDCGSVCPPCAIARYGDHADEYKVA